MTGQNVFPCKLSPSAAAVAAAAAAAAATSHKAKTLPRKIRRRPTLTRCRCLIGLNMREDQVLTMG